jgi:hypothetical protein
VCIVGTRYPDDYYVVPACTPYASGFACRPREAQSMSSAVFPVGSVAQVLNYCQH